MVGHKQLFLSHTWCPDTEGRDTHARALVVGERLRDLGWTVWIDAWCMKDRIDHAMAAGIEDCDAVLVLLTRAYHDKVNAAAAELRHDACLLEFDYSFARSKRVVPVVFEPCMLRSAEWHGIVGLRARPLLYVDGSECARQAADRVHAHLLQHGLSPAQAPRRARKRMRQLSQRTQCTLYL